MASRTVKPGLRVSDADRDSVADALRRHWETGRLSVEELEGRLATAYGARTERELSDLLRDLPKPSSGDLVAAPPLLAGRRSRFEPPWARPFFQQHDFDACRERVFADALAHVVAAMVAGGYDLTDRVEPTLLVFETRERPAWVGAVCVLAFPLGLLSLLVRHTYRVVVVFDDLPHGGTSVTVRGVASRPVRRAFAALSGSRLPG